MDDGFRRTQPVQANNTEYESRLAQALIHDRRLSAEELLRLPLDAIAESLVNEHAAPPVIIKFEDMWLEQEEFPDLADPQDESLCIITKFPAAGATSALIGRGALPLWIYSEGGKPSR